MIEQDEKIAIDAITLFVLASSVNLKVQIFEGNVHLIADIDNTVLYSNGELESVIAFCKGYKVRGLK